MVVMMTMMMVADDVCRAIKHAGYPDSYG